MPNSLFNFENITEVDSFAIHKRRQLPFQHILVNWGAVSWLFKITKLMTF